MLEVDILIKLLTEIVGCPDGWFLRVWVLAKTMDVPVQVSL